MKINWGTSIAIVIVLFIGFIMMMVIPMLTDKEYDHDLVVEEYYKKELEFQEQLNKEKNSAKLSENLRTEQVAEGLLIYFPKEMQPSQIEGSILLYRPSDKKMDRIIPILATSNPILIPGEQLLPGRWNVEVDWKYTGESYYYKQQITY